MEHKGFALLTDVAVATKLPVRLGSIRNCESLRRLISGH